MLMNLNPSTKTPLYIQLYTEIKLSIQQQTLQAGDKLPSKRQLAELNGISQNTVLNAYEQLLTEGYIYAKERQGYYVADVQHLFHVSVPLPEITSASTKIVPQIRYNFTESIADSSLFPFDPFKKIMMQLFDSRDEQLLRTANKQGLFELRQALQIYLSQSRGVPCSPDQIILGPSTQYLIQLVMQLMPSITDIGIEDPGYKGANQLLDLAGYQLHPLPLDHAGVIPDYLNQTPIQLVYLTPNHQFPTGSIMPLERRQALLEWTRQSPNRFIIEDDYDSEFKYAGIPVPSFKKLDTTGQIIYMGSFSRILAPSLRFSYMVLPHDLIARFQSSHSELTSPLNTMNQWMLYEFMSSGQFERHLNRSRRFYKRKREQMIQHVLTLDPLAEIIGADAGLHLLLKPSFSFNAEQLAALAAKHAVKLTTLADYATNPNSDDANTVFLSFSSIDASEISSAIEILYQLLKQAQI